MIPRIPDAPSEPVEYDDDAACIDESDDSPASPWLGLELPPDNDCPPYYQGDL